MYLLLFRYVMVTLYKGIIDDEDDDNDDIYIYIYRHPNIYSNAECRNKTTPL